MLLTLSIICFAVFVLLVSNSIQEHLASSKKKDKTQNNCVRFQDEDCEF